MSLLSRVKDLIVEDLKEQRDHYTSVDELIDESAFIGAMSEDDAIERLDSMLADYRERLKK
jgi:hypothetical protein